MLSPRITADGPSLRSSRSTPWPPAENELLLLDERELEEDEEDDELLELKPGILLPAIICCVSDGMRLMLEFCVLNVAVEAKLACVLEVMPLTVRLSFVLSCTVELCWMLGC